MGDRVRHGSTRTEMVVRDVAMRQRAARAVARSADLQADAARLTLEAASVQSCSRRHLHFARVAGRIDGSEVTAVVWGDGSVAWIGRRDRRHPSRPVTPGADDPLALTLRAARECEELLDVVLYRAGTRPGRPRGARMSWSPRHGDPSPEDCTAEVTSEDGAHVVHLRGELDIAAAPLIHDVLFDVPGSTIVVDLSGLSFIDARGLSTVMAARAHFIGQGHHFLIRGAHGIVRRAFEICGFGSLLGG